MISNELIFFTTFILFIIGILYTDLKLIGKDSHILSFREALGWTAVWVSFAIVFYFIIFFFGDKIHGIDTPEQLNEIKNKFAPHLRFHSNDFETNLKSYRTNMSIEYLTGYLIEYSLSIDNIFVILMLLTSFSVKEDNYKQVLFWGILGAIVLRCIFIFAGAALIQRFNWILYIFGAFLVYSGVKMYLERNKEEKIEPQKHKLVIFLSRHFLVFPRYVAGKFFIIKEGKRYITPLLIVLILIEFTDLIFALDSIPAVFAITLDPYVVFFSNIFAIIGLRSLFFLIMKVIHIFHFLKIGVSFLLVFIGFKLLGHNVLDEIGFESVHSLIIILLTLILSIVLSIFFPKKREEIKND